MKVLTGVIKFLAVAAFVGMVILINIYHDILVVAAFVVIELITVGVSIFGVYSGTSSIRYTLTRVIVSIVLGLLIASFLNYIFFNLFFHQVIN